MITKSNLTLLAQAEGVYLEPPEVTGFHITADRVTIRGFTIWYRVRSSDCVCLGFLLAAIATRSLGIKS